MLQNVASEVADRPRPIPFFHSGVLSDVTLARQLRQLHIQLEKGATSRLGQETVLLGVLAQLIIRHADDPPSMRQVGQEPQPVTQIKQYIENFYAEEISLNELSQLTHLSRYYLIRVFREAVGVPPHAYLRQVRIKRAKELLACGQPIADVGYPAT